jgi:hypothetical protein
MDQTAHLGDFQPGSSAAPFGVDGARFSDEQRYALAQGPRVWVETRG